MKKLLSCILVLVFVFSAGSALAGMSLYDMWHNYTHNKPGYGGKKTDCHCTRTIIENKEIGPTSVYLLQSLLDDDEYAKALSDLKYLLRVWTPDAGTIERPFFNALLDHFDNVDVEIEDSEFYEFLEGDIHVSDAELYFLNISVDLPEGKQEYEVLVCLQLPEIYLYDWIPDIAEYIVLSGDLEALGVKNRHALLNFYDMLMVVNCEQWVSLRKEPNAKADRLAKVPLWREVDECFITDNDFVFCRYFGFDTEGTIEGYIHKDYLTPLYMESDVLPWTYLMHWGNYQDLVAKFK